MKKLKQLSESSKSQIAESGKAPEHIPVMLKEVTNCFAGCLAGCFASKISDVTGDAMKDTGGDFTSEMSGAKILDCTFGRGGHSQYLLDLGASVVGLDRDEKAIRYGQQNFEHYIKSGQLKLLHSLWDVDFILNDIVNGSANGVSDAVDSVMWKRKHYDDEGLSSDCLNGHELDDSLNGEILERDEIDQSADELNSDNLCDIGYSAKEDGEKCYGLKYDCSKYNDSKGYRLNRNKLNISKLNKENSNGLEQDIETFQVMGRYSSQSDSQNSQQDDPRHSPHIQNSPQDQYPPQQSLQSAIQNTLQNPRKFDGILIDMGVSSPQIDDASYGFSYMKDSPLNMCMGLSDISAFDVVNNMSESEIEEIIRIYGEERYSKKIAAAIVKSRKKCKIETTFQLKDVISSVIFDRFLIKSCARVFQAIRIFVNNELGQLADFLKNVHKILKSDGVLCCIAYHSLEDRIVKRFFSFGPDAMNDDGLLLKSRYYSLSKLSDSDVENYTIESNKIENYKMASDKNYKNYENHTTERATATATEIATENAMQSHWMKKDNAGNTGFHKHIRIFPSKEEIASNSRSRSAIMRYGVKK